MVHAHQVYCPGKYKSLRSGFQPGVHGPLSGPQNISGGPQNSKFCVTVNRRRCRVLFGIIFGGVSPFFGGTPSFIYLGFHLGESPPFSGRSPQIDKLYEYLGGSPPFFGGTPPIHQD